MGRIIKKLLAAAISFTPVGALISTNVQAALAELDTRIANSIPAGKRGEFYSATAPTGWLKANGAAVPVASYMTMTAAIYCGDANNATALWGYRCTNPATPTTTRSTTGAYIVLPDGRGEYSRGLDDGRGIDIGRSLWAWQAGQNLAHSHGNIIAPATDFAFGGGGSVYTAGNTSTTSSSGGTENLVRGLAALVCIKY